METDNTVRRLNKKSAIILVVLFLAVCSVAAVGLLYVLNKGRRQRVLLESAGKYMAVKDYPARHSAVQTGAVAGKLDWEYVF